MLNKMVELLSGRSYYGKHATGTVVLVNGRPHHFTGPGSRSEAQDFMARQSAQEAPGPAMTAPVNRLSLGQARALVTILRAREVTLVKTLRRLLRETSGGTQPCNADVVKAARKVLK